MHTKFSRRGMRKIHLEDLGVDGRAVLKLNAVMKLGGGGGVRGGAVG